MSYALEIAPDASSQWRELPVDLQEFVLDKLDRLAQTLADVPAGPFVHDAVHRSSDTVEYLFIRLIASPRTRSLTVLGVARYSRQL